MLTSHQYTPAKSQNLDRPQDKEAARFTVPAMWSWAVSLTEINEHLAIALSHVLRHGKDTGYIIVEE